MPDLLSSEVNEYRALEIEEMSIYHRELLKAKVTPEYFKGAMDAFKRIIKIPEKHAKQGDEKAAAVQAVNRAFAVYETRTMRKLIVEE